MGSTTVLGPQANCTARDHRNDRRVDGAVGRRRDSRHGRHVAPVDVRSLDCVRVSSGLEACISRDLLR